MKTLLAFSVCALASAAAAQIAVPNYTSTYSGSPRGYCMKAPTAFVVTHLMVPDEQKVKGAKQLVALFRLNAAPPSCCISNGTSKPVFQNFTTDPGKLIPVIPPVAYKKDEWLVVLGAVTATGRGGVSYAGAGVQSTVLGFPVTLNRCGIQMNMQAAAAYTTLWGSTSTATIGRVRVFVAGHAKAEPYGTGSGGELDYSDPFPPSIGKKGEMILKPGTASNTGGVLAVGLLRSNQKLPFGNVLVSPLLLIMPVGKGALPATGTPVSFNIPNQNSLLGVKVTFQGAVGLKGGLTLTNGMEWQVNK